MPVADLDVFDKAERAFIPHDRRPHVGNREHRNNVRVRRGSIEAHGDDVTSAPLADTCRIFTLVNP